MCSHDKWVTVGKLTTDVQTSRSLIFLTGAMCVRCIEKNEGSCTESDLTLKKKLDENRPWKSPKMSYLYVVNERALRRYVLSTKTPKLCFCKANHPGVRRAKSPTPAILLVLATNEV